jgi:hypothetical protein
VINCGLGVDRFNGFGLIRVSESRVPNKKPGWRVA